jgi:hypothetical protein
MVLPPLSIGNQCLDASIKGDDAVIDGIAAGLLVVGDQLLWRQHPAFSTKPRYNHTVAMVAAKRTMWEAAAPLSQ